MKKAYDPVARENFGHLKNLLRFYLKTQRRFQIFTIIKYEMMKLKWLKAFRNYF